MSNTHNRTNNLTGGNQMNKLYKTTLLITMAVVTWKVVKIEQQIKNNLNEFTATIRTDDLKRNQ